MSLVFGQQKSMNKLYLSPNSVSKLLSDESWVETYFKFFEEAVNHLETCKFPDNDLLKIRILDPMGLRYLDYRSEFQRWMLIAYYKNKGLLKAFHDLDNDLKLHDMAKSKYDGIELGPIPEDIAQNLNEKDLDTIRKANIILGYTKISILNTCGHFISELFFSFEAMCRVICMSSCLEIFLKTITPNISLQHQDISKALNRLSNPERDRVLCKMCKADSVCKSYPVFRYLADFYLLLYHMRIIRDYRKEYFLTEGLANRLINTFLLYGFRAVCKAEKIMGKSIGNRMRFPLSLSEEKENVEIILSKLRQV
ncbi:MAG: hypothetical protein LWW94_00660 [Candidatus Desulfofervidaceae bacterium]|nr:hypothetical protein [Candidatus Desulfofervidaceae bacterium]